MKTILFLGLLGLVAVVSAQNQLRSSESSEEGQCNCVRYLQEISDGKVLSESRRLRCHECGEPAGNNLRPVRGLLGKDTENSVLRGSTGSWGNGMRGRNDGRDRGRDRGRGSSSSSSSESEEHKYGRHPPHKPGYGGGNNRPGYGNNRPSYGRPSYGRPSYGRPSYGYSQPSYGYGYNWYPQYQWPSYAYDTPVNDIFQGQPAWGWQYSMRSPWGTPRKPYSFGYSNGGGYGGGSGHGGYGRGY